jgi:hypothetical protein
MCGKVGVTRPVLLRKLKRYLLESRSGAPV